MKKTTVKLESRRKKARYGDKAEIAGTPVAIVKSGKTIDYVTAEEFAEDLYGRAVDHIVFKDEMQPAI